MIKYAVMTFMYNGWVNSDDGSHEELIKILGESGAEGIEAFANHFMENDALLKLYQQEMKSNGLKMPVMDLLANLACSDKKQRDEAYERMRMGIDICDALDTEIVHVAGCSLVEGVSPEDGRKLIAEGLSEFVDDVEKRGMTLAIENYCPSPTLICSASDCLEILDLTGNRVKFVFDNGNFEASGEYAEDNFEQLIDRTCHFHFKDFKAVDDLKACNGAYFGQGRIKNRKMAQAIKKSNYSGWVALESYLQDGNGPRETIPKELAVLKSMF
jgi:sugar phosphate isomerase/epimerase